MRTWLFVWSIACSDDGVSGDKPGANLSTGDTSAGDDTGDTVLPPGEATVDGYRCHGGQCLLTRAEVDVGNDGTVDAVEDLWVLHSERVELRYDADGDGEPETRYEVYDHDEACQLAAFEEDDDRDGVLDFIGTYDWEDGLLTGESVNLPGFTQWSVAYGYDSQGQRVLEERDDLDDGSLDAITAYLWDADNQIRQDSDSNADGLVDLVRFWSYDGDGHVVAQLTDWNNDGAVDETVTWTWDGDRPLRAETDLGADGTVERLEAWVYDAQGNEVEYRYDVGNDGQPERRLLWVWDSAGQLIELTEILDNEGDGVVDTTSISTRTYADGLLATEARDLDGNGTVDEREVFSWSCPAPGD